MSISNTAINSAENTDSQQNFDLKKYCDVVAQDIVLPILFKSYSQKLAVIPFIKKAQFFAEVNELVSDRISQVAAADESKEQLSPSIVESLKKPWKISDEIAHKIANDPIFSIGDMKNLELLYQCYQSANSLPKEMSCASWQEFYRSDFMKNIVSEIDKIADNFSKPATTVSAKFEPFALKQANRELLQV